LTTAGSPPPPPPASAEQFQNWLAEKQHGEMAWLERNAEKRLTRKKCCPERKASFARGQLCSQTADKFKRQLLPKGHPHSTHPSPRHVNSVHRPLRPQFADYHDVLGERLKQLTQFVNQLGGAETRSLWYVDTGPVLERDFAQRAGLGFVGKHTNLISRRLGNWIFLAEIVTTLELEPDAPEKNHCGKCTRCITACPTRAITAPFQLDARPVHFLPDH
jgi:epoxyqueuosine reductase